MPDLMQGAEGLIRRKAGFAGYRVEAGEGPGGGSGRQITVSEKAGPHSVGISLIPKGDGFVAGVFLDGDHTLQGLPHRTGTRGVLEPVRERIAEVSAEADGSWADYAALIDRVCSRIANAQALADQDASRDRRIARVLDVSATDPEMGRDALKHALMTTLTPGQIDRFFEAFDERVDAAPSPGPR